MNTYLKDLGIEINAINAANGWNVLTLGVWDGDNPYRIPGILALVHEEVSEAVTAYRKNDKENFAEELADVFIRTLDIASGLGVDLDAEVAKKLEKNKTRGYRHGGKKV
jgi:NTP pyrophosphatase (non-canonical NTP hydrolase)